MNIKESCDPVLLNKQSVSFAFDDNPEGNLKLYYKI